MNSSTLFDKGPHQRQNSLKGLVTRLTIRPVVTILVWLALTAGAVAQPQAPKSEAVDTPDEQIRQAIETLRNTRSVDNQVQWAGAIRDLAKAGDSATLALVEALDGAEDQMLLRTLGFTVRAIGDPRAVPALIRAIPKTLLPPSSDYRLLCDGGELLKFMQDHDLHQHEGGSFNFWQPMVEILGALVKITGQSFDESELYFVFLSDSPVQQAIQHQMLHDFAIRWAGWWEENWRKFTADARFSKVDLRPIPEEIHSRLFPSGEKAKVQGIQGMILTPANSMEELPLLVPPTYLDVDTGRLISRAKKPSLAPPPDAGAIESLSAWAAREGIDLMGSYYDIPGGDGRAFALKTFGVRAWQVANDRWDTIATEISSDKPLVLGRPASEWLMDFDEKASEYRPMNKATFVFITREGAYGILQVTGQIIKQVAPGTLSRDVKEGEGAFPGVQFAYQLFYEAE